MAPEPTTSAIFRALRSGTTTSLLKSAVESGAGPHVHSLHLATLFGFAVAQPLFDLIGRHPEFLVAQGIGTADLVACALGLALALPLCGWGVLVLLNQLSTWLETATAVLSVGFLSRCWLCRSSLERSRHREIQTGTLSTWETTPAYGLRVGLSHCARTAQAAAVSPRSCATRGQERKMVPPEAHV